MRCLKERNYRCFPLLSRILHFLNPFSEWNSSPLRIKSTASQYKLSLTWRILNRATMTISTGKLRLYLSLSFSLSLSPHWSKCVWLVANHIGSPIFHQWLMWNCYVKLHICIHMLCVCSDFTHYIHGRRIYSIHSIAAIDCALHCCTYAMVEVW